MPKVIGRVVQNLQKDEIIFDYQSGFRSRHFVNTCLAHLSNHIMKEYESRKSKGMILIDLRKAFDTLDHGFLWKQLKYIGFSPET